MSRTFETAVPQLVGLADLGTFLDSDGKDELINGAVPLVFRRVVPDQLNRYGPRWIVSATRLDTGEVVAVGMPQNPTRNAQFEALAAALAEDDAEPFDPVCLIRVGKKDAMTFRTATSAEVDATIAAQATDAHETAAKAPKLAKAGR